MPTETCDTCGATMSGDDRVALVASALDHYTTVHPEWGLNGIAVENYFDAKDRLSNATERLASVGRIEVHQVTPDRIDALLVFLDRDGFAGNPEWASCYCMFFHRDDPRTNGSNPWRQNRADLDERIRRGATIGYLAYTYGKPAGWCNASPRSAYPIRRKGTEDDKVGLVACFVIAPPYRRHGVAGKLLEAAIEEFRARGMKRVQAHPRISTEDDAPNYHGPLSLYLEAGFEIIEQNEKSAVVVKELL